MPGKQRSEFALAFAIVARTRKGRALRLAAGERKDLVITDSTAAGNTRPATTTVLLAVENPAVRRRLTDGMAHRGPFAFVEANSPDRTEELISDICPGALAVVDMTFGGRLGASVHLVEVLRRNGWDHIVALGDGAQLDQVGATLQAGARAYLFTSGPRGGDVPDAPVDRRPPVDPAAHRVRVLDTGGQERELSHREVEVLRLAAEGLSNGEIGQVLGLSSLTVKSHLARITHRLRARDRAHLVLLALRAGAIR